MNKSQLGRLAKGRGYRFEKRLEALGNKCGLNIECKRQPLSGAHKDHKLDVKICRGDEELGKLEGKYRGDFSGFKMVYKKLEEQEIKGKIVAIQFDKYIALYYTDYLSCWFGDKEVDRYVPVEIKGLKIINEWYEKAKQQGACGLVVGGYRAKPIAIIWELKNDSRRNRRTIQKLSSSVN